MKLAVRIFALTVVVAGASAAALAPKNAHPMVSHQASAAAYPGPYCGPHVPTCQTPEGTGDDELR